MTNLPTKKLGEVAEVIMGQSPPSSSYNERGEGLPFFQGKAEFGEIYPTPVKYCSSPSRIAEANDVLMSVRAPVGNINLAKEKSCVGRGLGALRAKKNILNQMFLFYFMKKNENNWARLSTGSTFSAIRGSSLKNFEIPLPPLKIQKQIVERLDKIVEAQKLNDGLIQKTEELFQSLLHKELNPADKDWEIKKLGSVFDRITDAILPTKHPEQKFNFIGLENIESNTSRLVNISPVQGKFIKSTKTRFKIGDILYGKLRPYLNKVWLADFDGICSTDIWALRAKEGIIFPQLLGAILQQSSIVQKSSASMAGANLPRANKDIFDKITIVLPPLKTQKQIVAKLSAVQDYKKQLLEQKSKLKELFNSALVKSMSNK
ncbi:MAG: restriction endonuclease subunit S [bacterium]|nr:restriction endonuclease subunit S [bacterium]